jgi:cation:H+ antiporter
VIIVFVAVMMAGIGGMVLGSQRAVGSASGLAATSSLPPFFIGVTLLAIGTDLPEIANSLIASATDHGDINVGDSVGSAATQATLILGLLPILAGTLAVPRRGVFATGVSTTVALCVLALLVSDGHISRVDAAVMLVLWVAGSWLVLGNLSDPQQLSLPEPSDDPRRTLVIRTFLALAGVGVSAVVTLWAIVNIAEELSAPEFLVGFFLASIGTSLPELVFDVTALRRGETAMAIGDLMGACFLDATLSVAIGPLFFPTALTLSEVRPAIWWSAVAMALVTLLMSRITRHDWRTGVILITIYAGFFVVLL